METEVISERSNFSELKQLVTEVKHVGRESFLLCRNKRPVLFVRHKKTAVTQKRCEGECLSLKARKWQGIEKIPSKKLQNFCRSLNIINEYRWAACVARGIDMQRYKIQQLDTTFFVGTFEWVRIF